MSKTRVNFLLFIFVGVLVLTSAFAVGYNIAQENEGVLGYQAMTHGIGNGISVPHSAANPLPYVSPV